MRYFAHEPPRPLADFVHSFWDSKVALGSPRVRILPRGTVELIINLSEDVVRIYDSEQPGRCQRLPGIVVSGAYGGALDIDPMQHATMMGVHFRPGGAFPFLGPVVAELANKHLGLESLWGRHAVELRERLCAAATPQKRFQILEEALTARLNCYSEHPAVSLALQLFGPAGSGSSVRAVADRLGLCQRRFIQLFTTQVGLRPKIFCRVLRFMRAREFVDQAARPDWSQIALACGYYDQSHLIHDFQEFSGLSPTEFLSLPCNPLMRSHARVLS